MWYRSLYWRIGFGFVALLAILLGLQALLFLYLSGRGEGWLPGRSPSDLGSRVATELSWALSNNPSLDLEQHVRERWGRVYQPFAVVMVDGRVIGTRDAPVPPGLVRAARFRLRGVVPGRPERGGSQAGGAARPQREEPPEQLFDINVNGARVGLVVVSTRGPQLFFLLREFGPALGLMGVALLLVGAAAGSLVIFKPARERMRKLEEAAAALGAGRTTVRAPDEGADEVAALARAFNRMAAALDESHAARRRLLADVSHELRTPLTAIRGYVETLSMPQLTLDAGTRERYLRIVEEETRKLERLVGDLLDVSRLEGGGTTLALQPVSIERLFQRVADRHERAAGEKGIRLQTEIDPTAQEAWADPDRLEQALQNLAANALRHTPAGGCISLRAASDGPYTRIVVEDTGAGIPAEHLPHVFDRFYKVEPSRATEEVSTGSGLGLSIVQAIVEGHGGAITAANRPGGGAVFEIRLPNQPLATPATSH